MTMKSSQAVVIKVEEKNIDNVQIFIYQGTNTHPNRNTLTEINERFKKDFQKQYGVESWKTTEYLHHKLDVFQNRCLRKVFKIYWPNKISSQDLLL